MGTNFYLKRKDQEEPIHIGKRSYGWRFLWDAHEFRYFEPNEDSIYEFLNSGIIKDEYGREFTYKEFMDGEVGDSLTEGFDLEKYYAEYDTERWYHAPKNEIEKFKQLGVEPDMYGEFRINDLLFTTSENFS